MEGKERVCVLKYHTGVSNTPRLTAEKEREEEEAVVVVLDYVIQIVVD